MIADPWQRLLAILYSDPVAQALLLVMACCLAGALLCLADRVRERWPRRESRLPVLTTPAEHRRLQELRHEARLWRAKRWLRDKEPLLFASDLPALLRRQAS